MPGRTLTLDALAGWTSGQGPMAELDATLRLSAHLALFGTLGWSTRETRALGGVRVGW